MSSSTLAKCILLLIPQALLIRIIRFLNCLGDPSSLIALSSASKQLQEQGDLRKAVLAHLRQAARGGLVHMLWQAGGLESGSGEKQFNRPGHISVDWRRKRVAVPCWDRRIGIVILDLATGKVLSHFGTMGPYNPTGPLPANPTGIASAQGSDVLFISDYSGSRVVVARESGEALFSFGGLGSGAGQLHTPAGILLTPEGALR